MVDQGAERGREAEEAEAAIREGIERARALLSERLAAVQQESSQAEPPNPAILASLLNGSANGGPRGHGPGD